VKKGRFFGEILPFCLLENTCEKPLQATA